MNILKNIIFVFLTILLSGCFTRTIYQADSEIQKPESQISLLNRQLNAYDVHIIQDRDSMVLVLPNKTLFNSNSANFTQKAYKILDLVFDLTSYYEKSVISVVGFAGNRRLKYEGCIAVERANKVVQYLWKSGIDASFMYAVEGKMFVDESKKHVFTDCVVINFRKLSNS